MGDGLHNQPVRTADSDARANDEVEDGATQQSQASYGAGIPDSVNFHAQSGGFSQQQGILSSRAQQSMTASQVPGDGQNETPSAYDMGSVANALPQHYGAQAQVQRGQPVASSSFRGQQYVPNAPFAGPYGIGQFGPGLTIDPNVEVIMGQQGHAQTPTGTMHSPYSPYAQQLPQYYYPTSPYAAQGQHQAFYAGAGYDARQVSSPQAHQVGYMGGAMLGQGAGRAVAGMAGYGDPYGAMEAARRQSSDGNLTSVPRGPPRKPKQSGHALWVGNLPPGTTVLDLKDHFSRDATREIESLFLISKSNCAFVNYRTEASCAAAMQRFHDSRFHGVRLVCRLRRSSAPPASGPSEPSATATTPVSASSASAAQSPAIPKPTSTTEETEEQASEKPIVGSDAAQGAKVPEKYFIVKSLTLQDLDLSVRNGVWATQSHNEEALNRAYQSAENVYLIFSANKSGEYFGYARMTSPISEDAKELSGPIPRHEPVAETTGAPRTIPTPATETAPKGHVIDDSARGTIFWEADHSDDEGEEETRDAPGGEGDPEGSGPGQQSWGRPFKVEWMSTNRLPFYRTRGLRNPWNANREVKIARDGTELEPGVGARLVQMFHRMGQPAGAMMPHHMAMPQMVAPQHARGPSHMGAPPHMRPYG